MVNKNYKKGRRKEYKLIKELKEMGFDIAQRTAGSHSPIDIFAIHKRKKLIAFIQSKPDNFPKSQKQKILDELNYLNGVWRVVFALK